MRCSASILDMMRGKFFSEVDMSGAMQLIPLLGARLFVKVVTVWVCI